MTFKVIIFIILSCVFGIKKPIWGGFIGAIASPILSIIHMSFDLPTVIILIPFGFGFGLLFGVVSWNIFHGSEYNKQNEKTYYMPMTRNMRGGFIYTDEEVKNEKDNKKQNIK